ncbi:MAG TPA: hypothetical protein VFU81_10520, partial [Thermomicrobiales bacterium]|nr:hypothetical protein [Thermomicrobiales bacterium]
MENAPPLDPLGAEFVAIAFGIERRVPGFVDAYVGPPAARTAALADAADPQTLLARTERLAARVAREPMAEGRRDFLTSQLRAMAATLRRLGGEIFPYVDEVRLLFDIEPTPTPEARFDEAIRDLAALLPGEGPVGPRMVAWRQGYAIPPETALRLIDLIAPELRRRTEAIVTLPPDESVEFALVSDQPWSGYNWYLGGGRSRVELNTDLPIYAFRLTDLLAHEAYPGHHTEHALKERLYRFGGRGEHAIQLINTPECVISEGIATLAEEIAFSPDELARFRAEVVYPAAGVEGDPAREIAIAAAQRALRAVPGNAALLLHAEGREPEDVVAYLRRYALSSEGEARQRLRFISDPLWRAYIFTYHAGDDLLGAWSEAAGAASRRDRCRTLLTEPVTPSWAA